VRQPGVTSSLLGLPPWRIVGCVAAGRLYLFALLCLFFLSTDLRRDSNVFLYQKEGQSRQSREAEIRWSFWERLAPLDGQFYLDIANKGYRTISSSIHGDLGNYAFFPLLPCMLAAFKALLPSAYIPLTIAVIFLCGIVGTLTLWRLAEKLGVTPLLAVGALLCFPSAPFQYILYNEGIALCLTGLALLYILERRHWPAICFGLLAGLSRPQGVLLAIPAFVELVVLPGWKEGRKGEPVPQAAWLAALAPLGGFVILAIVSEQVSGSPFSFLTVQSKWGRSYEAGGILKAFMSVFRYEGPPMDLLGLLVGIGCIPLMRRRLPPSLFLYAVATVLMPLSTGSILSMGRFISVSLPHMLALAIFLESRGQGARLGVLAAFLVLQAFLARGLVGWYFVG
jgi:hypothetical protein